MPPVHVANTQQGLIYTDIVLQVAPIISIGSASLVAISTLTCENSKSLTL